MADRASIVARWTNTARELVDAPPNVISPAGARRAGRGDPRPRVRNRRPGAGGARRARRSRGEQPDPSASDRAAPRAARCADAPRLALVGKAVTFDTGGYFLKPQSDIVRQKADMAGGAAVVAALGAIAELGLPLHVTGFVPACENMLSGTRDPADRCHHDGRRA